MTSVDAFPGIGPALVAGHAHVALAEAGAKASDVTPSSAAFAITGRRPLVVHAKQTARRLGQERIEAADLLELFAFVRPAKFCRPTPSGLAEALGLTVSADPGEQAELLWRCAETLLAEAGRWRGEARETAALQLAVMAEGGWAFAAPLAAVLGEPPADRPPRQGLEVWVRLPEWADSAPAGKPGRLPVEPADARRRLTELVARGGVAEPRPSQADYSSAVSLAFGPRSAADSPVMVLAEAGTGTGKTLGYLAPASLFAEQNQAPVWIATYTRNLQSQIDTELSRLYPDPALKSAKVVLRKGRENYACLLNYEEAVRGLPMMPDRAIGLGLIARWLMATRDGDMLGGDLPGWLPDLLGRGRVFGLTDRRGECIYSNCPQYQRCFIERSLRAARRADIVIGNHALVMAQAVAAQELPDTPPADDDDDAASSLPQRIIFDEGHHLFAAADSAFAVELSGAEMAELRRWLLGPEGGRTSRAKGLSARIGDMLTSDAAARGALDEALRAARMLPGEAWLDRLALGEGSEPSELFLAAALAQAMSAGDASHGYALEADPRPASESLIMAAQTLSRAFDSLRRPLAALMQMLRRRLIAEAATLSGEDRRRLDAVSRGLWRRGVLQLNAWCGMLDGLAGPGDPDFIDTLTVPRQNGRPMDVILARHWVDPTRPLAEMILKPADGVAVTSATLTAGGGGEDGWDIAERQCGSRHLAMPPIRARLVSPFDHAAQTRVLIVNDVRKDDLAQVASAYQALFLAAHGGALGLFTAISRLKAVGARIAGPLESAGLPLYAQHMDALDVSTLIEIFRGEHDSCLLGTDAVRDGIDVPGDSLRLIVFDRVPWPRPDPLHKARREAFGGRVHDDRITRARLAQAFGRLVRRADDRGIFVLLDPLMPSRLHSAFPAGVSIERVGLAEACTLTAAFLGRSGVPQRV